jgi:hypothetical protein
LFLAESASLAAKSIADAKKPMDAPMTAPIINVNMMVTTMQRQPNSAAIGAITMALGYCAAASLMRWRGQENRRLRLQR